MPQRSVLLEEQTEKQKNWEDVTQGASMQHYYIYNENDFVHFGPDAVR